MKAILAGIVFLLCSAYCSGQAITGNRLLELVGKPVTNQLFVDLKRQETFYTDAWDEDFTIYTTRENGIIKSVELQNGKIMYGTANRYGVYAGTLPLGLKWGMSRTDFAAALGSPVLQSGVNFSDYISGAWKVRVSFEDNKAVSVEYKAADVNAPATTHPAATPQGVEQSSGTPSAAPATTASPAVTAAPKAGWLLKLNDEHSAELNWPLFKRMINSYNSLLQFAVKDSVDYMSEVYYKSAVEMPGFKRAAIKRIKKNNQCYFEAFFKMGDDTNKVKNTFFALYDAIKASVKANGGDNFILASVAKKNIHESPMNWMAQWSLYPKTADYTAKQGMQAVLLLTGLHSFAKPDEMEYTIKFYLCDKDVKLDMFTWDKPE